MVWIKIWNAEKVQSSTKFKKDWKTGWENAEGWGIQKCPDRCPHAVRTKSVNWYFRCAAGGVWFGILHCVGTLFAGFTHTFCAHSLNHSHTTWEQNAFKTWTIAITEIMMNVKISEIQFSQRKISFQRVWKSANKTLIKEFGCRLNNRAFFSFFLERWNEVKSKWNEMKSNVWLPKWCTPQIIYPGVIRHTKHCAEIFVPLSLRRWIMGCTMGCMQFFFLKCLSFSPVSCFFFPNSALVINDHSNAAIPERTIASTLHIVFFSLSCCFGWSLLPYYLLQAILKISSPLQLEQLCVSWKPHSFTLSKPLPKLSIPWLAYGKHFVYSFCEDCCVFWQVWDLWQVLQYLARIRFCDVLLLPLANVFFLQGWSINWLFLVNRLN